MPYTATPAREEPTRAQVERLMGPVLLEFGATWCPHCQALQPDLADELAAHPEIVHLKIEDGPGRQLGRSFRVKLWPNLVFMLDGRVLAQLARPSPAQAIREIRALAEVGRRRQEAARRSGSPGASEAPGA